MMLRMTRFGFITPIEAIPTPDLAVPYAAPISVHKCDPKKSTRVTAKKHRFIGRLRLTSEDEGRRHTHETEERRRSRAIFITEGRHFCSFIWNENERGPGSVWTWFQDLLWLPAKKKK